MPQDGVLAVTIGAQRHLRYPVGKSFAMNAAQVLFGNLCVAHAAGIRHGGAKRLRPGLLHLMGAAVAYAAIRRGRIALRKFLAVHAFGVFARLFLVARGAGRFGGAGRVRIFLVTVVAGVAGQGRVSALGEFGLLIVTGGAVGARG